MKGGRASGGPRSPSKPSARRAARSGLSGIPGGPVAAIAAMAVLYTALFGVVSKARFDRFAFRDQDLAQHAQALWVLLHGKTHISVFGVSFLGNHLHWATFLLAPFYVLLPNPVFLLIVQTLALAAGVFPLYRIAERRLGSELGVAVVGAYLLYPALGYVNLSEFHMPSLIVPLLLWAHDAYELDRRGRLIALLVAVALIQENFPLFGVAYGVLLAVKRRDLKRGLALALGCLAYFYIGFEYVFPIFWKNASKALPVGAGAPGYFPALGGGSVSDLIVNFARNPFDVVARVYEARKGLWLLQLLLPLALLPLAGAEWLLPAAPYFLQHFLSVRANETSIRSHYASELIPFLFIATVVGLARVRRILPKKSGAQLLGGVLLAAAIAGNIALGCQIFLVKDLLTLGEDPPDRLRRDLIQKIPPDASTVASFDVLTHLVNRHHLYTLDHVARGTYTMSRIPYRLPDDTRYALIDWIDELTFRTYEQGLLDRNLARAFADGSWRVVEVEGPITLLQRDGPPAPSNTVGQEGVGEAAEPFVMPPRPFAGQLQLFQLASSPPPGFAGPKLLLDGVLELLDASVVPAPPSEGNRIRVALVWRLRAPAPGQYMATVEIIDTKGKAHAAAVHPLCYNIFPPTRWTTGQIVREDVWLPAGAPLAKGDYGVAVRVDPYLTARKVGFERLSEDVVLAMNRAIVSAWRVR